MNQKTLILIATAVCSLFTLTQSAHAQGTAFTYQGQLNTSGAPANGSYDLAFSLFATNNNGVAIAGPVTNSAVGVTNGLFTTTVDFGIVLTGASNWLLIAVSATGSNAFVMLAPRQQLTAVPYAITAANLSGTVSAAQLPPGVATNNGTGLNLSGTFTGNGGGLTNLNASQLTKGAVPDARLSANVALRAGGNSFIGNQLLNDGNLGIFTASPSYPLQIGDYSLGSDQYLSLKTAGGNLYRAGIKFRHYNDTGGFDIEDNEISGTNGLVFWRFPYNLPQLAMFIDRFSGYVGIDTPTPSASLDVAGTGRFSVNLGIGTYATHGYLEIAGSGGGYTAGGETGFHAGSALLNYGGGTFASAIFANGDVVTTTSFLAISDERIKNIVDRSDGAQVLNTLRRIEITDYRYKDVIAHGNHTFKKVIAQQVERVYPQAVSKSIGEVPDIYKPATIKDGWIQLATDLKVGDRVKLISEKEQAVYPVLAVRDGAFRTAFKPNANKAFVYGREVNDFRRVDYEAISMLNVSATQELARKLDAESSEVAALKQELADMKKLVVQLARDNHNARLAANPTTPDHASATVRQPLVTAMVGGGE